ncbi:hypothetical protein [Marinilabilia sp.]|uniref:hypothetical protein n=1 Tax=Marinilabilia sp. TaxID=2021252 RepID=UPI0025C4A139|nr:hypothetical protein [Marinilabilia sp.]
MLNNGIPQDWLFSEQVWRIPIRRWEHDGGSESAKPNLVIGNVVKSLLVFYIQDFRPLNEF